MSMHTVILLKDIFFTAREWDNIVHYANCNYFVSDREAIRFLIGRALRRNGADCIILPSGEKIRKKVPFSDEIWQKIKDYQFDHRIENTSKTIRVLVHKGLEVEKEWIN